MSTDGRRQPPFDGLIWGHPQISLNLLIYKSMACAVSVVVHGPPPTENSIKIPYKSIRMGQTVAGRESNPRRARYLPA